MQTTILLFIWMIIGIFAFNEKHKDSVLAIFFMVSLCIIATHDVKWEFMVFRLYPKEMLDYYEDGSAARINVDSSNQDSCDFRTP